MKSIIKSIINVILGLIGFILIISSIFIKLAIPISLILFTGKIFGFISITWFIVLLPIIIAIGILILLAIIWLLNEVNELW